MFWQVNEFKKYIEDMASASLRCIAFAYRHFNLENIPNEEQRNDWLLPEDDLILLAIVGMKVGPKDCTCNYLNAIVVSYS